MSGTPSLPQSWVSDCASGRERVGIEIMTTKTFRILVLVSLVLSIASIVSEIMAGSQLPEPLREYREEMQRNMTPALLAAVLGALSVVLLGFIGTVGLLFFWRPGRIIYTIAIVAAFPLSFMFGPIISTELSHFLLVASTFLGGVIWALMYFSPPVQEEFDDADAIPM